MYALLTVVFALLFIAGVAFPTRGRAIGVYRGASPENLVAGARTKSLTINGSAIDVTTDDDAGVRKLLDQPGQIDVTIQVSGVLQDESLLQEALSATDRVQPTEFRWPGDSIGGKISGDFFLESCNWSGEYQGQAVYDVTFQSAGAVTFQAAQ